MNYEVWDAAIQDAITKLPDEEATTRSQKFIKQFPTALTQFRNKLSTTKLSIPLAEFQQHPTYLLRWLLAQWKDEETKTFRTDLGLIMTKSAELIQRTQSWRSGEQQPTNTGENYWAIWGFKNMDDMYNAYRTPSKQKEELQNWYFQQFYGLDALDHPVHFELLPNTYRADLILPFSIRRILNNEHTLRHRIPMLNPPPPLAIRVRDDDSGQELKHTTPPPPPAATVVYTNRSDVLSNPILGATWILDARQLSIWSSSQIYKTATALINHSVNITSLHYPEQGFRAIVINLGVVLGSMYNMCMRVMPATTQATTRCFIGNEPLGEIMGGWENVPVMFHKGKPKAIKALTKEEQERATDDAGPFDR